MKLDGMKKLLLLGMILLIIAGCVVVALKGFNVSLIYRQHEELNLNIGKKVEKTDINNICKEVFNDKSFTIKPIELFEDSISIRAQAITNEEKNEIINKVNEKYGTEIVSDDISISQNPNIRIRDLIRPYRKPVIATSIVIMCYLYLKYRTNNAFKFLGKILAVIVLSELVLASLIAITRIPVSPIIVNLMVTFGIVELLILINNKEKEINGY